VRAVERSEERRKFPRLGLATEQFRHSRSGKVYSVADLSIKGMAFLLIEPNDIQNFPVGTLFEGTLNLRRIKYSFLARVRNLEGDRIGCEFEKPAEEFSKALEEFLDPSSLGAELKPIPSSDPGSLWFHGPSGTELVVRPAEKGEFKEIVLYVFDDYIRWDREIGIKTGSVRVAPGKVEMQGVLRWETLLLDEDSAIDEGKLKVAKKIILSSNLSVDLKQWCTRHLER
jgi:hypothetical protein